MTGSWKMRVTTDWQEGFAEVGVSRQRGKILVRASHNGGDKRASTAARLDLAAAMELRAALDRAIEQVNRQQFEKGPPK